MSVGAVQTFIARWRNEIALAILSVAFTFYHLGEVLQPKLLAGWDLPGHYYLYTVMLELLGRGEIAGYDTGWFAGFDAFRYYPPGAYLLLALPHVLSFGALDPTLSFNLVVFLLPLLMTGACYYAGHRCYGQRGGAAAALLGLLFLAVPCAFSHMGVGIGSVTKIGLLPAFFGSLLLVLLFAQLTEPLSPRRALASGVLLGALLFTHHLSSLFAGWTLALFLVVVQWERRLLVTSLIAGGAALIAGWWLLPFAQHFGETSAQTLGLLDPIRDPLLALFPGLVFPGLGAPMIAQIFEPPGAVGPSWLPQQGYSALIVLSRLLLDLPFIAILMLLFGTVGLVTSVREGRWFLPALFLTSLLLLPRDLFSTFGDSGIHFYRFIPGLFLLNVLLGARGMLVLCERLGAAPLAYLGLGWAVVVALFVQLDLEDSSRTAQLPQPTEQLFLEQYPAYPFAQRLMSRLLSIDEHPRVIVEAPPGMNGIAGTPHLFSSLLPQGTRAEVLPGLMAESSPLTPFLQPALYVGSSHMRWGRAPLVADRSLWSQGVPGMMHRFRLLGAQYLITSSRTYFLNVLNGSRGLATLIAQEGPFALFALDAPRPRFYRVQNAPVLFEEAGGASFSTFSQQLFLHPELAQIPVIGGDGVVTPDGELSARVLSLSEQPRALCEPLITAHRARFATLPLVLIGAPHCSGEQVYGLPTVSTPVAREMLFATLSPLVGAPSFEEVQGHIERDRIVVHASGPTVINYTFSPHWRAKHRTVWRVAPTAMLIWGQGEVELRYR